HDFAADIFYGGVEGVFHETLEALEARAEQMRANSICYAIVDADKDNYDYTYVAGFLRKFEGFGASPYYPTSAEAVWGIKTIGYGHRDRNHEYADNYVMSEEEAFKLLIKKPRGIDTKPVGCVSSSAV
ncbi:MAG: lysozyme, partial [Lachnospiraceae bacterium]|nr:lysozyme [Lachnospiraceae bacterium]